MTRISHVSAVHNEERWLRHMVKSWQVEANGQDVELILVDDHSTDTTFELAREFAESDPRIRAFSSATLGRGRGKVAAFNLGFEHSRGDFVGLMAGDDEFASGALAAWRDAIKTRNSVDALVAFGRLRTMSDSRKANGIVIPRRPVGNRSGGTSLFSRSLAELVFPIPEELSSEDAWTAFVLQARATTVIEVPSIVLKYRIHDGNSNPRNKEFAEMSRWMQRRARAYSLLLESDRLLLSQEEQAELRRRLELETLRASGDLPRLLTASDRAPVERIRMALMSRKALWRIRQSLFRYLSGW